jgi:hypothetical protein
MLLLPYQRRPTPGVATASGDRTHDLDASFFRQCRLPFSLFHDPNSSELSLGVPYSCLDADFGGLVVFHRRRELTGPPTTGVVDVAAVNGVIFGGETESSAETCLPCVGERADPGAVWRMNSDVRMSETDHEPTVEERTR